MIGFVCNDIYFFFENYLLVFILRWILIIWFFVNLVLFIFMWYNVLNFKINFFLILISLVINLFGKEKFIVIYFLFLFLVN